MKIFQYLYDKAMVWSRHKHAPAYLGGMTFAESIFFPVPPDVMLAPMALASPDKAWRYAFLTSVASVLGGIAGYCLGLLAFESLLHPMIVEMGYQHKMDKAVAWFEQYGVWVVFIAGFSPIPYKVFTVSAGFLQMAFLPFVVASTVGRAMRFYLVAGLMRWGGKKMEDKLRDYVETLGWATVVLAIVAYLLLR
ncbi:YqaA family protein [Bowmanella denitrificans]|uniref:YqaA family protein n=1 Tax=Bowmanella denitrificans TaxID=366582 RepID=A0ABP3GCU3_9ALTE|nr:YqaA family protein [Bowmanella denitrificans]